MSISLFELLAPVDVTGANISISRVQPEPPERSRRSTEQAHHR